MQKQKANKRLVLAIFSFALFFADCGKVWAEENDGKDNATPGEGTVECDLYPLELMDNKVFTINENIPAPLIKCPFFTNETAQKRLREKAAVFVVDLPEFIRLGGVSFYYPMKFKPYSEISTYEAMPFTESLIIREGVPYRRYRVSMQPNFGSSIGVGEKNWYRYRMFLVPEENSKGRTGNIFWSLEMEGEKSTEDSHEIEILPPLGKSLCRMKYFKLALADINAMCSPFEGMAENMMDYWSGLCERPTIFRRFVQRQTEHPELTERRLKNEFDDATIIYSKGETIMIWFPDTRKKFEPVLQERLKAFTLIDDKGKPNPRSFPCWYLLDDPEKIYEQYLRMGFAEGRRRYPDCKTVIWDYEPFAYGYCEEGRKRFAASMKLENIPSPEEIRAKYSKQWYQYMVDQHAKLIEKTARIFKEEWPETKFYLCTDPLHAGEYRLGSWCAVDAALADKHVDGFYPMPYYAGTRFFDDVEYNMQVLKKPNFILNDPAEPKMSFFMQYSPEKIRQNMIASAALGCEGFGFWEGDAVSGEYFPQIQAACEQIAAVEEFYQFGDRAPDAFQIKIMNVISKEMVASNGEKVTICTPDLQKTLRSLVHRINDRHVITVFNYDDKSPMIINVTGQGSEFLAEISANGVKILNPAKIDQAEQERLAKALDEFRKNSGDTNSGQLQEKRDGQAAITWVVTDEKKQTPLLKMRNAAASILIDALGGSDILAYSPVSNSNPEALLGKTRFLGEIILLDPKQGTAPYPFVLKKINIRDDEPTAVFAYRVPPFEGANPEPNPLMGLEIEKTITLSKDGQHIGISVSLHNPTKKAMSLGFRLSSLLIPGNDGGMPIVTLKSGGKELSVNESTLQDNVYLMAGKSVDFLNQEKRQLWDGETIEVGFGDGAKKRMVFEPSSDYIGVYCWKRQNMITVEPFTENIGLAPGEKKTTSFSIRITENQK